MCALFGICADVPGVLLELMVGFNVVSPNPVPATKWFKGSRDVPFLLAEKGNAKRKKPDRKAIADG